MVRLLTITAALAAIHCSVQAANLNEVEPNLIDSKNSGTFFVEYYNSNCKKCDEFEPNWEKLIKAHPTADFGRINCGTHFNYCKEKGITHTPTIQSNVNGGAWSEYTGDFSMESVEKYIEKHITKRNEKGQSIELTTSQELKDIINSKEPWFVKFYAPWCGHCQHLQPVWKDMARNLRNKVNVAEVNCEDHRALCQEYRVSGLPTLSYFVHGANLKYNGERKLDTLEEYAIKTSGSPVQKVKRDSDFERLFKQNDVKLVYVRESDDSVNELPFLETVAPGFMENIPFYTTTDKKSAVRFNLSPSDLPATALVKDGTYHLFKGDMKDLAAWVLKESKPLVTRVLPHNSNSILRGRNVVVLGITRPDDEESESKLRDLAKKCKEEKGDEKLTFAILDGKLWGNYISRAYGISSNKLPAIVVLDPKQELYFDRHANNEKFSFTNPEEVLKSIADLEQLTGTSTAPSKAMGAVERFFIFFGENWMAVTPVMAGVFILVFYLLTKNDPREELKEAANKVIEEDKKKNPKEKKED